MPILCFQGIYLSGKELRKLILPKTAPFEEKLRIHKEVLCARHLPVFHEWFLRTFPDPTSWYKLFCPYIYGASTPLHWCVFFCTVFSGTAVALHTAGLLRSCPWWATFWVWEIATEKISSSTLSRVNVYMLTSTASSTRFVTIIYFNAYWQESGCNYFDVHKGETFDVPEVVPFRLTQNMVHAMGPMGTEGLFRQACEVTLRLMRDQREPLMR